MTQITTHVLDTATGRPVAGMPVTLAVRDGGGDGGVGGGDGGWRELATAFTDADGRSPSLPSDAPGVHRLRYDVGAHHGPDAFFPQVSITFRVGEDGHLHVPLLLSPFGYTTYRGS